MMNLATIGTSAITKLMLDHSKDLEDLHRVACYSRNMDSAKAFAAEQGFEKAYDDLAAMLADEDVDTVYIASPNALHYPQAKQALEAGKNVILEKPFTSTVEEAEDLFATAEKNGVMIFEAITNIHTPNFGLLKDNLEMAGNLKEVVFNFSQYSSRYDKYKEGQVANAFNPKMEGGALVDINVYNIHLAAGLFGKPESVTYFPVFGFNGIDTSGILMLEYPAFNVVCIGSKDCMSDYLATIQGDDGTFIIDEAATSTLKNVRFKPVHAKTEEDILQISIDQGPHMTYEIMDFLTAISENNQEMYKNWKDETLMVMRILEEAKAQRAAKAARQGK